MTDPFEKIKRDSRKTLTLINEGKAILPFLMNTNEVCDYINETIIIGKELGKGKAGTVYEVLLPGKRLTQYVVKKIKDYEIIDMYQGEIPKDVLREINDYKEKGFDVSGAVYIPSDKNFQMFLERLNGVSISKPLKKDMLFKVPKWTECLQKNQILLDDNVTKKKQKFNKGSYICPNSSYNEYIFSLIASDFYQRGICINFLETFGFGTCYDYDPKGYEKDLSQYVFIEKVDMDLEKMLNAFVKGQHKFGDINLSKYFTKGGKPIPKRLQVNIIFQLMFAMLVYQETYKISHNDLHGENVLIKFIRPGEKFNGQDISKAEYFSYQFRNKTYYLPFVPFVIKIADWERGVKWTEPIIGNAQVLKGSYTTDTPSSYFPMYDMIRIFSILEEYKFGFTCVYPLIDWIYGRKLTLAERDIELFCHQDCGDKQCCGYFPSIKNARDERIKKLKVRDFFDDGMWDFLTKPPKSSKIVSFGKLV